MRTLAPAPRALVDPLTGAPAFGSYVGPLPRVALDATLAERVARRKRWWWLALACDEAWVSLAVVRTGYAASAFAFVWDRHARRMLFDRALVAPPWAASVTDDPHGGGELGRFGFGRSRIALARRPGDLRCALDVRLGRLAIDASFDDVPAPSVAAIARLSSGPSVTEKRALAAARGSLEIDGRRIALDGALAGYDYTQGLMPRHTRWRWAFAMGHSANGAPVALNVVDGFVGEAECVAFRDGRTFALAEPRIQCEPDRPERPWRIAGDGVDLEVDVGAVHAQRTSLGVVRSRFVQPVGLFRGTLRVGDERVVLDGVPGVVEDQDVVW